jgi:hypothetical protein
VLAPRFFGCLINFNVVRLRYFEEILAAVGSLSSSYQPPTIKASGPVHLPSQKIRLFCVSNRAAGWGRGHAGMGSIGPRVSVLVAVMVV